jgi:oligosaccharyl transferase (archaeosortase A-associated)
MSRKERLEIGKLMALLLFGLLLRLIAGRQSLINEGIMMSGYDEYYHMRRILYTVNHFPDTLWFDSYLDYPHGMNLTWPPFFDQLSAALALALGQHNQPGVETVAAFLPVVLGGAAVVVVYYMIREVFDRNTALLAAFMTAIAPYHILKTMIGATDHHCLEVLLLLASLLFMLLAFSRHSQGQIFAAASGVMMAGLEYTWSGALIYLGIFLAYAAVQIIVDQISGTSSKENMVKLLIAFGVALIIMLPFWNAPWLFISFFGIVVMIVAILIMFAVSYLMAKQGDHWIAFPLTIIALIFIPLLISKFLGNLFNLNALIQFSYNYLFGGGMVGKIAEAEPLFSISLGWDLILNLLFSLSGLAAFAIYIARANVERRSCHLLLFTWITLSIILTIGEIRFLYLSTIGMGIMIAFLYFWIRNIIQKHRSRISREYAKPLAVALLIILILPTAIEAISVTHSVPAIAGDWYESLRWLSENSNSTSFYDCPEKSPEYSVMNWWDYGNWVIYEARRPVVANNFQAGITDSAKFYLSENEETSTAVLDARRSRYIIVDYDMIYSKLSAIAIWANESLSSYLVAVDQGSSFVVLPTSRFVNTTLARLYLLNGAGMGHFRLIYESSTYMRATPPKSKVKIFEYVPGALIRVTDGQGQRVGALLNIVTNQGKAFEYVNEGSLKDGKYEIRVPYSTESTYGTHATGQYEIFSENEGDVKIQNINVSEQDIYDGKIIYVVFKENDSS